MLGKEGQRLRPSFRILRHRLVVIKKLDFFKASPGEETEKGVCFQWVLKIVSATVYGFLS